jgi:hypothetical protein
VWEQLDRAEEKTDKKRKGITQKKNRGRQEGRKTK